MEGTHVQGGRKIKLSQPQQMMAQSREIIDEAYAGDIIGVFDPAFFSIGDTICTGKKCNLKASRRSRRSFLPHAAKDTMKRKQFVKGTTDYWVKAPFKIFRDRLRMEEVIVGVVGTAV